MRVRVAYTVEVDDDFRHEVRQFYGKDGLASREEVKRWFRAYGDSMNDDLGYQSTERAEQEALAERVREEDAP